MSACYHLSVLRFIIYTAAETCKHAKEGKIREAGIMRDRVEKCLLNIGLKILREVSTWKT
jgi:hypothetical protein